MRLSMRGLPTLRTKVTTPRRRHADDQRYGQLRCEREPGNSDCDHTERSAGAWIRCIDVASDRSSGGAGWQRYDERDAQIH